LQQRTCEGPLFEGLSASNVAKRPRDPRVLRRAHPSYSVEDKIARVQ